MYNEIQELYKYCKKIGIDATLEPFFDGYRIDFPNGCDVVQHSFSYGSQEGCIEPAIGSKLDFRAVPLENAKQLIKRHKEKLIRGVNNG